MFIMLRMYILVLFFVLMCQEGTPFVLNLATVCVHVSIRDIIYVVWMFLSIIKRGTRLISKVQSISKWPPYWIYYDLNMIISHEQPHFIHIRTYHVFLSLAHTAGTVSSCSSIADV